MRKLLITNDHVDILNKLSNLGNLEDVIDSQNLGLVESHNSMVTTGIEEVEVRGLAENGDVLVFFDMDGWVLIPEKAWINLIWNNVLADYTDDSKLSLIRTIPHLKNYTPEFSYTRYLPLQLFIWRGDADTDNYVALAHTVLEARFLISLRLGFYPDILEQDPEIISKPTALLSGDVY